MNRPKPNSIIKCILSGLPSENNDAIENSLLYTISRQDFYTLVQEIDDMTPIYYRQLLETAYLSQNDRIMQSMTMSRNPEPY